MLQESIQKREEGFTLIELLVVVIIIGILAAIAIPVFLNQREKAWDAAVKSDLRNAATAQETWFTDNSEYTSNLADLESVGFNASEDVKDQFTAAATTSPAGYCMEASHKANPTRYWTLDNTSGAPALGNC